MDTKRKQAVRLVASGSGSNQVGLRLSDELLSALDQEVEKRRQATPWREIGRVDVVREALFKLLQPSLSAAPALVRVATPQASPPSREVNGNPGRCRICQDPIPEGRKALCGKKPCVKDDKNARERERRKALRSEATDASR